MAGKASGKIIIPLILLRFQWVIREKKVNFLQFDVLSLVSFPSGIVKRVLGRAKQVGGGREFGVCVCARFLYIPGGGGEYICHL